MSLDDVKEKLIKVFELFIAKASSELPVDVVNALNQAYEAEVSPFSKSFYEAYFKNLNEAKVYRIPICQDTGSLMFFVKAGTKFPYLNLINEAIVEATRRATRNIPLRPNAVDPFTHVNSGDNTGLYVPFIEVELVPNDDKLQVYIYPAGGGSSLPGTAKVFPPGLGLKAVKELVIETIAKYGPNACPPLIVGIGIAATAEVAALLAKKALLRTIGTRHPNPEAAKFELELKEMLNELNIGVQGVGGKTSVLEVFVEYAYRHPASLAAAVVVGCWAHRRGLLIVYPDLTYEMPLYAR